MTTKLKVCQNCRYCVDRESLINIDCLNSMVSEKEYKRCLQRQETNCNNWNSREGE